MINWILLAVDQKQVPGLDKTDLPYFLNISGSSLLARQVQHFIGRGFKGTVVHHAEINQAQAVRDALKDLSPDLFSTLAFDGSSAWAGQQGQDVVVLVEGACYLLDPKLVSDMAVNAHTLKKEHLVYSVEGEAFAVIARVEQIKTAWKKVQSIMQQNSDKRYLCAINEALMATFDNHIEEHHTSQQVCMVADLLAQHEVTAHARRQKMVQLMRSGVVIMDMNNTYIDEQVTVGAKTLIYPNSILTGNTVIGEGCSVGPGARIENSRIANAVTIKDSTIVESDVDDYAAIGPYAYLRPKSSIGKHVKIGDFVEVKNARVDDHSKVSHLSYIGDGTVGKNVNVGCGVVFVNYDGKNKFKTVIEDGAFIGCNANLVAPVTVHSGAYVAAGSTITDDVEANSLAIARSRQTQKLNWVSNKQDK